MKKLILIIILSAACNKQELSPPTAIKILERETNLPISGAKLALYRCYPSPSVPCNLPGVGNLLFQGVTDDSGICKVPTRHYEVATSMTIESGEYWQFEPQRGPTVYLTPMGWLQLRIRRIGHYPVGSYLEVSTASESGRFGEHRIFITAETKDTLVWMYAFGAQQNNVNWEVGNAGMPIKNGTLNALQIPRFDTLKNITLEY